MKALTPTARGMILLVGVSIFVCAIALAFNLKTRSQKPNVPAKAKKEALKDLVETSPNLPLRIAGNEDCPFRILGASVKQVSGPDFSDLTGKKTDLPTVISVPEVKLVNTSDQTITSFVLVVRDPGSRSTRGFVQQAVSIAPGTTYLVTRDHFWKFERHTVAESNQAPRQVVVLPRADSEDYWLQFPPTDTFVTIGKVTFQDGSRWRIKEGGEVR